METSREANDFASWLEKQLSMTPKSNAAALAKAAGITAAYISLLRNRQKTRPSLDTIERIVCGLVTLRQLGVKEYTMLLEEVCRIAGVDPDQYHREHQRRLDQVVAPPHLHGFERLYWLGVHRARVR